MNKSKLEQPLNVALRATSCGGGFSVGWLQDTDDGGLLLPGAGTEGVA